MPSTFVRSVPPGSRNEWRGLDWPARCSTRSGRTVSTSARAWAGSLRSVSTTRMPCAAAPGDAARGQHGAEDLDLRLLAAQIGDQVAADEAARSRDQQSHR